MLIISIIIVLLFIGFGVFSVIWGLMCVAKPSLTIKLFQIFAYSCNWKVEPVSMEKELKNTRMLGIMCAILGLVLVYVLLKIVLFPL